MPPEPVRLAYEHKTIRKQYDLLLSVIADMMETRQDAALEQMIVETYKRLAKNEDPKKLAQFKKRLDQPYPLPHDIDAMIPEINSPDIIEESQLKRIKKEQVGVKAQDRTVPVRDAGDAGDAKLAEFERMAAEAEEEKPLIPDYINPTPNKVFKHKKKSR